MGLAAAVFHWTPAQFMAATAHEFFAAYECWQAMNAPADEQAK